MPDYLLPCTCGRKTAVTLAQAGEAIRCACGAELQVPSMRHLRAMETADVSAHRGGRVWDDRHRVMFLFVLGSLCGLGVAGYLTAALPKVPPEQTAQDYAEAVERASPADLLAAYRELKQGLDAQPPVEDPTVRTRNMTLWGIGISLFLAIVSGIMAALVAFSGSRKPPSPALAAKNR